MNTVDTPIVRITDKSTGKIIKEYTLNHKVENGRDIFEIEVPKEEKGMDIKQLYENFCEHIDNMTDEEIQESAEKANQTGGYSDIWFDILETIKM